MIIKSDYVSFNIWLENYDFDKWDELDWDSLTIAEKSCISEYFFLMNYWYIESKIEKRHQKDFLEWVFLLMRTHQLDEIRKESWWLDEWIQEIYKELKNRLERFDWTPLFEIFANHYKNEMDLQKYIIEETKYFILGKVVW